MEDKVKVLCVGDVEGRHENLFKTVSRLNAKAGPFAAVLCVGRFFSSDGTHEELLPYIQKRLSVPAPTYFITAGEDDADGSTSLIDDIPDGGELCANLTFLGRRGVRRLPCGLEVAFISGVFHPERFRESGVFHRRSARAFSPFYLQEDVDDVIAAAAEGEARALAGVDFLLTSEWGENFDALTTADGESTVAAASRSAALSPAVASLASRVSARYHVAGTQNAHVQLPPYKNPLHATRFYGLGKLGDPKKAKSVAALATTPTTLLALAAARDGKTEGEDATPCPYTAVRAQGADAQGAQGADPQGADGQGADAQGPAPEDTGESAHESLPDGGWRCGECGNVNRAHQTERCNMNRCGAPRRGPLGMWRLTHMSSFAGKGVKRDAEGGVSGRGVVTHGASNRDDGASAAGATNWSGLGSDAADAKRRKAEARPSLYQGQRAMTGKQKFRKGTRNPGAWR